MMKILLFLLLTGAGAGAFVAPAGHSSSESPSSTEIKATTKSKSLWIADTTSRYPYIDEIDGTVEYERVPWQVLNFWLSELNGNIHVNNTVCKGVEREKIVQELVSRWDYTREKEERDESLSSELGYGLDWKEYENSQGYTHFEELLIYQPKEWRKLARDYIYHHEWDLERMSYSTMRKVEKKYLTDDGSEEMMTIPMHKPALVVLFHPDMRRTRRYEALNFLLAYGVENPLISLFSGMNAMQKHLVMKELSPLDYFIDFQQRVQSYSLDMLREVGKRCAFPRIPLIKELDVSNVVGQRLAKHVIRQQVVKYILKRSVEDEHGCTRQPLSMIFAGPSGNGKTELAMRLAQLLNQPGEDSFLKIDCGKLTTSHEVFGMSGAYYGSREDSALNNFVLRMSQRPESVGVVLLDEIEKAGEDVIYGLYQVIDKAEWTNKKMSEGKDGHTETVSCFNIIFIMTTNAADKVILDYSKSHDVYTANELDLEEIRSDLKRKVRRTLQVTKPYNGAFVARVGGVVPFLPMANSLNHQDPLLREMMTLAKMFIKQEQDRSFVAKLAHVDQRISSETKHRMAEIIVREAGVRAIRKGVEEKMGDRILHTLLLEQGGIGTGSRVTYSTHDEDEKIEFRVMDSGNRRAFVNSGAGYKSDKEKKSGSIDEGSKMKPLSTDSDEEDEDYDYDS